MFHLILFGCSSQCFTNLLPGYITSRTFLEMPPENNLGDFLQVPRNGLTLDLVNGTQKKVYENKPAKFGNLVS